jgi:hypothetical protein
VSFLNVDSTGDCGDIITAGATPTVTNLVCSGLYTGGGGNSVPLPFAVPDNSFAISRITACTGQTGTLGGTTSTQTGSNRTCTGTGCLFGAPLAVPNSASTPTSVCVINAASTTASGTVVCNTGVTTLSLPLSSTIYLTGDRQAGQTGIQPCPTCRGGMCTIGGAACDTTPQCGANGPCVGQTCFGGPNNGLSCAPGTNISPFTGDLSYPTTHDCPPDGSDSIGSLPVAFLLNTGTVTWTGTAATNDTGSTASVQTRVFSGFCRDVALPGGTGSFDVSATTGGQFQQCWENGTATGGACSEALNSAESCEQRAQGAFGPNGGANRTIQAIGNAMSLLGGPAPGTLVSIFSIPPTFDATIDSAGDLPGPGAVSIVGTANLCSALNCM